MVGIVAGIAFGVAVGLLLTFFVTGSARADRWSNAAFLVFYAAAAFVVYAINERYAAAVPLTWAATAIALGALALLFATQTLILAGRVGFQRVAMMQTGAFTVYILWILAASSLILAQGGLPTALGQAGVAAVVLTLAVLAFFARDPRVIRGEKEPDRVTSVVGLLPLIAIAVWLVLFGVNSLP